MHRLKVELYLSDGHLRLRIWSQWINFNDNVLNSLSKNSMTWDMLKDATTWDSWINSIWSMIQRTFIHRYISSWLCFFLSVVFFELKMIQSIDQIDCCLVASLYFNSISIDSIWWTCKMKCANLLCGKFGLLRMSGLDFIFAL